MATINQISMRLLNPDLPVGSIIDFAGNNIPSGYLECDGSEVLRSVYPDLFDAIGTTWGAGDGSTTFNLPDLNGRTLIGRTTTKSGVNANLAWTDLVEHVSGRYDGYHLFLSTNMAASTQYTLTLWDVDVYHSAKNSSSLNLMAYWGGGSIRLATYSPTSADLSYYPDGHGFHADKIVLTFTTSTTTTTNGWINIYNSVGYVAGTLRMHIGKWKLERGSTSTAWIENKWGERYGSSRKRLVGDLGGSELLQPTAEQLFSHTHEMQSHYHTVNNHSHTMAHYHGSGVGHQCGSEAAGYGLTGSTGFGGRVIVGGWNEFNTGGSSASSTGGSTPNTGGPSNNTTTTTGSTNPFSLMQPYAVTKKIIRALQRGGVFVS